MYIVKKNYGETLCSSIIIRYDNRKLMKSAASFIVLETIEILFFFFFFAAKEYNSLPLQTF